MLGIEYDGSVVVLLGLRVPRQDRCQDSAQVKVGYWAVGVVLPESLLLTSV